ncbi:MAG: NF038122 family metalloprotease, partial [Pirellulales bacterium]
PSGPLAQAISEKITVPYSEIRSRLIFDADGRPNEAIVNQLPTFSELNTIVPDDPANPFTVLDTMDITRANAKALGVPLDTLPGIPSDYDPSKVRDARIEFSNDPIIWDYDRTDGVLPGLWDFAGVAIHEIGHTLGFVSETGSVDGALDEPGRSRNLQLNTLDLFRLSPGTGEADFTAAPRNLDPNQGPHVLYDGGFFDPIDVPLAGLRIGDVPMSTGKAFGDGQQGSHFKDDALIDGVFLGMMDPTVAAGVEVMITSIDRQAFDLIGWDIVGGGLAGDWQGITLEQQTNDRNVDIATEYEPRDVIAPGDNAVPDTAQFLGTLAPEEKAGDDNQRLGVTVYGFLNSPGDLDVYSFEGSAGTEVWFDIDRTASSLDSVVELLDASGEVLARSDNSLAEGEGTEPIFAADGIQAHRLQRSVLRPTDYWSVNPKDAGMRVVLPGTPGVHTYFVRVRSSSPDLDDLAGGLTSGNYQLQLRLRDIDEFAGASIQFADIRYANNGILIRGLPQHSPLTGETAEDGSFNDTLTFVPNLIFPDQLDIQGPQLLGNVLNTDRAALSVAGAFDKESDIDWYQFDVTYDSVQNIAGFSADTFAELIFDLDYADGLARPDTSLAIYKSVVDLDDAGNLELLGATLIYVSDDAADRDDLPAPLAGANTDDLSRGSVGKLDPLVGSISLPAGPGLAAMIGKPPHDPDDMPVETGTYWLAISSSSKEPLDLDQFKSPLPNNPYVRLEPINSLIRVAEDHIGEDIGDILRPPVAEPPQVPNLLLQESAVPYQLGDLVLFVTAGPENEISTVNPFTGFQDTVIDKLAPPGKIGDFAFRNDGNLYAFSRGLTDAESGNYLRIDPATAQATNLGDDMIVTFESDLEDPPQAIASDSGVQFGAIAFPPEDVQDDGQEILFAAGFRSTETQIIPNILYMFFAETGEATSGAGFPDRGGDDLLFGAMTDKVERGILETGQVGEAPREAVIFTPDATDGTQRLLTDGMTFKIAERSGLGRAVTFELNSGPEVTFDVDPTAGQFVRDGDVFTLDGAAFEFDTGAVLVMDAPNGSAILDGATFTIVDNQVVPEARTFEFDDGTGAPVGSDRIAVPFSSGMTQRQLVDAAVSAINGAGDFNVEAAPIDNRISLAGDSNSAEPTVDAGSGLGVEGTVGGTGSLIRVEETFGSDLFVSAIQRTITTADTAGNRLSFPGVNTGVFTEIINRGVFVDQGATGGVTSGNRAVDFLVSDTAEEIAAKMEVVIDDRFDSLAVGATVELLLNAKIMEADPPLIIAGGAPGGAITGMTFIGDQLYAVSDRGGLYLITNYRINNAAKATYIKSSAPLLGIKFAGLTKASPNLEGGRYEDMMFGIDEDGDVYAFDTDGQLKDVFVDGQSSVSTGIDNPQGLAFSPLDQNLWNITTQRGSDVGHDPADLDGDGIIQPEEAAANQSFRFGGSERDLDGNGIVTPDELGPNKNFDFAGGARGSLISNPFSLKGYVADDQPMFYFNYFLVTEEAFTEGPDRPMRDSLRVFVSVTSRRPGHFCRVVANCPSRSSRSSCCRYCHSVRVGRTSDPAPAGRTSDP